MTNTRVVLAVNVPVAPQLHGDAEAAVAVELGVVAGIHVEHHGDCLPGSKALVIVHLPLLVAKRVVGDVGDSVGLVCGVEVHLPGLEASVKVKEGVTVATEGVAPLHQVSGPAVLGIKGGARAESWVMEIKWDNPSISTFLSEAKKVTSYFNYWH